MKLLGIPLAKFAWPTALVVAFSLGWLAASMSIESRAASRQAGSPETGLPAAKSPGREGNARGSSRGPRASARRGGDPAAEISAILDDGKDWQPGSDKDYPRLLAALQRRAGLSGLELRGELLLSRIVTSWYDANPDAAFSWVLGIGKPKDEGELLGEIAANCELGDDFPFRIALEGLASDYLPTSLLDEWAKRDFGAAWQWSQANVQSPSQLQGMAEAWSEEVGDDEVAEFAARLMDESHWNPEVAQRRNWGREQWRVEHMLIVREMLTSRPSPDRFRSLLERVSDRQESLSSLVRLGTYSKSRFREEVLNQMTADERMTAFESIEPDFRSTYMRDGFEEPLRLLGHSREEIDWMLPAVTSD